MTFAERNVGALETCNVFDFENADVYDSAKTEQHGVAAGEEKDLKETLEPAGSKVHEALETWD